MEPLNNLESAQCHHTELSFGRPQCRTQIKLNICENKNYFRYSLFLEESPQEINLAKIPNFIIKFIPLTFPGKIEKINQIYKQWALKSNRHLFQLMFKVLEQSDIYGIWSIKV